LSVALVLLATFSILGIGSVEAFFPNNLFTLGRVLGKSHAAITASAILRFDNDFFRISEANVSTAMKGAIEEISDANANVDSTDKTQSASHFDGENFEGGQLRLVSLLGAIQDALGSNNTANARTFLGQALHTLQDFYAHSNWIEMGFRIPNSNLGRPVSFPFALPDAPTCLSCNLLPPECCTVVPLPGFLLPLCPNCSSNLTTSDLTSGYYAGLTLTGVLPEDRVKPNNVDKCSHGGPFDFTTTTLLGGINKDARDCGFSPHASMHDTAAAVATDASYQFLLDLKDALVARNGTAVATQQLKLLFGVGPTLTIAIDTTGSMGDIIQSVKLQAIQIVNDRLGTTEEPSKYVLAPFNDPFTGPTTVTSDPNVFKSAISSLSAFGGGDCPELSMTGMLQGLAASDAGGELFMFTDAAPKDSNLSGAVASLAISKRIKVFPIHFFGCSSTDLDPFYGFVAQASGGQEFFLARSEAGAVATLVDLTVLSNSVDLLSVSDSLSAKTYTVPVDAAMSRLTVSVSGAASIIVTRPNGTTVSPSDAGVRFFSLSRGMIVSITSPSPGSWGVVVSGTGTFTLNISGESNLDLSAFRFVEPGGRPGHEGLFPISGFPVAGQKTTVDLLLGQDAASAQLDFRAADGSLLQSVSLTRVPDVPLNEFFGDVTLPTGPFVVYISGSDASSRPYQRVVPATLRPQTVKVEAPVSQNLRAGQTTAYTFKVTNSGLPDTFRFSTSDDKGFVVGVSPITFTLGTDQIQSVTVQVQPPPNAAPGSSDTLTATVESASNPNVRNFAILTSFVAGVNRPPVANAGSDQTLECAGRVGTPVTLDGSASSDPDGDPLTFEWKDATGSVVGTTALVHLNLPLGTHTFTLTVTDPGGLSSTATTHVTVRDTTPPTLSVSLSPNVLWPPNHKLVMVTATIVARDICDPSPRVELLSITSNEPDDGLGDGDTPNDIQGAAFGTDDRSFFLRAERSGTGTGRTYVVTYRATDASGNSRLATAQVRVPHDQGKF